MAGTEAIPTHPFLDGYRSASDLPGDQLDNAAAAYGHSRACDLWLHEAIYLDGDDRPRRFLAPGPFVPFLASAAEQDWAADTLEQHWVAGESAEDLNDGGTHLLDLVAATDHLARGLRHDFTVWDALEEALRWWLADQAALDAGALDGDLDSPRDSDPLGDQLGRIVEYIDDSTVTAGEILQQAVRRWATETANRYNAGHHWPHPTARRSFPPPLTDA